MKWVLIVIVLSNWDGTPKRHNSIGEFDNLKQCEGTRVRLEERSEYARYVCANKYTDEKYIVVKEQPMNNTQAKGAGDE